MRVSSQRRSGSGPSGTPATTPAFFTERDLCARYRISRATLNRWRSERIFPQPVRLATYTTSDGRITGTIRWRAEDVLAYEAGCAADRGTDQRVVSLDAARRTTRRTTGA